MSDDILSKFPFLTIVEYLGEEHIGIIGNSDNQITSMYIFSALPNDELKSKFLKYGECWWWETNRQIPINIILKNEWKEFQNYMKLFITKEIKIISGPTLSLDNFNSKRIKRRQIQLVKKL